MGSEVKSLHYRSTSPESSSAVHLDLSRNVTLRLSEEAILNALRKGVDFKHVTHLSLKDLKLQKLPAVVEKFTALKELDLRGNSFGSAQIVSIKKTLKGVRITFDEPEITQQDSKVCVIL